MGALAQALFSTLGQTGSDIATARQSNLEQAQNLELYKQQLARLQESLKLEQQSREIAAAPKTAYAYQSEKGPVFERTEPSTGESSLYIPPGAPPAQNPYSEKIAALDAVFKKIQETNPNWKPSPEYYLQAAGAIPKQKIAYTTTYQDMPDGTKRFFKVGYDANTNAVLTVMPTIPSKGLIVSRSIQTDPYGNQTVTERFPVLPENVLPPSIWNTPAGQAAGQAINGQAPPGYYPAEGLGGPEIGLPQTGLPSATAPSAADQQRQAQAEAAKKQADAATRQRQAKASTQAATKAEPIVINRDSNNKLVASPSTPVPKVGGKDGAPPDLSPAAAKAAPRATANAVSNIVTGKPSLDVGLPELTPAPGQAWADVFSADSPQMQAYFNKYGLDQNGEIPNDSPKIRGIPLPVAQGARDLINGAAYNEITPAAAQLRSEEVASRFGYRRNKFTPKEQSQIKLAAVMVDEMLRSPALDSLNDSVWAQLPMIAGSGDPEKEGLAGKVATKLGTHFETDDQADFMRMFRATAGVISGLSQMTRSGKATQGGITLIRSELPNPWNTKNSDDARKRLEWLKRELKTALSRSDFNFPMQALTK